MLAVHETDGISADAVAEEARNNQSQSRSAGKLSSKRAGESSKRIDDEEEEGGYEGDDIVADDEDYD